MLYIIKSLHSLELVTGFDASHDAMLLVEDAIYAAISGHKMYNMLRDLKVYVLDADVMARGCATKMSKTTKTISYDGFVELTEQHSNIITWP
jgi:tRNA 2-thiouridine synthesizing protein B|tara:strand:- start:262 stop:537 length:276 start_codon:yes stop_codon:yes gene_type:complete